MTNPYLDAIVAAPVGAATEDGNGYRLVKVEPDLWHFTEPSEDWPGHATYDLPPEQAADVLENIFPGSFESPEAR